LEALPGKDVNLGTQVAGRLAQVTVSEGDRVKQGQLLARLEPGPLNDAVRQAEAAVAEAEAALRNDASRQARAEKLVQLGVSARQEADDAKAQAEGSAARVETAKAALSTSKTQLARSELRAPFDGVVVRVLAAAGEPVDANKQVVEVAELSFLELRAGTPPQDAARIALGSSASVWTEGVEAHLPAEVFAVAPGVDPTTGTVLLRVRLANPGSLRLGQLANARVDVKNHLGVVAVPSSALVPFEADEAGRVAVVLVDAKQHTKRVPIERGATDGPWTEVRSGVDAGQLVVESGGYALPEGTAVTFEPPAEAKP
jgi:RND family efflux transporter MFP subunit